MQKHDYKKRKLIVYFVNLEVFSVGIGRRGSCVVHLNLVVCATLLFVLVDIGNGGTEIVTNHFRWTLTASKQINGTKKVNGTIKCSSFLTISIDVKNTNGITI